jgi:hypothetical protein
LDKQSLILRYNKKIEFGVISTMNAKASASEIVPESATANLQLLSGAQRQQVFDFVAFLAQQQKTTSGTLANGTDAEVPDEKRQFSRKQIFGCLDGRISISDDFDAPLKAIIWLSI